MNAWVHGPGGQEALTQIHALDGVRQPEYIACVISFLFGHEAACTTGQAVHTSGGTKL